MRDCSLQISSAALICDDVIAPWNNINDSTTMNAVQTTNFQCQCVDEAELSVSKSPWQWSQIEVCLVRLVTLSDLLHREPCAVQSWEREFLYGYSSPAADDPAPAHTPYNVILQLHKWT